MTFCATDTNEAVKLTIPNVLSNKKEVLVGMTIQARVALSHVVAQDLKKAAPETC
jgi:hypothetical protein